MGESKIKFGDKLFLYGQFMHFLDEDAEAEYNEVKGYISMGGYRVIPMSTRDSDASVSGFVVEILEASSLTSQTPFSQLGMLDVTDKLARSLTLPAGTVVWMPTKQL